MVANRNDGTEHIGEGTRAMHELTGFQRDLLYVIAGLEESYGVAIQEELQTYYDGKVYNSRLYANLDELAEGDLVDKGKYDKRTNYYALADQGRQQLEAHKEWKERHLESALSPEPPRQ